MFVEQVLWPSKQEVALLKTVLVNQLAKAIEGTPAYDAGERSFRVGIEPDPGGLVV